MISGKRLQYPIIYTPLCAAGLLLCYCGVKALPEPPLVPAPARPGDLAALVREGCVELSWTAPEEKPPQKVAATSYQVLRAEEPGHRGSPSYMVIESTDKTRFSDCSLEHGRAALYKVRGVSAEQESGEAAGPVKAMNPQPPGAPKNPAAEPGDGHADVTWRPPEGAPPGLLYNLYRTGSPALESFHPVNPEPIAATRFSDGPVENGAQYFYEIRAMIQPPGYPSVEGPPARVSVVPVDKVPPAAPKGVSAAWTGEGVQLSWLMNQEPDLDGYLVWRRRPGKTDFKQLFLDPLKETGYLDRTARAGAEYEYAITAVDNAAAPNQSPPSRRQRVYVEP